MARSTIAVTEQTARFIHGSFSPHGFGPHPRAQRPLVVGGDLDVLPASRPFHTFVGLGLTDRVTRTSQHGKPR